MWVSRHKWESLIDRIRVLESQQRVRADGVSPDPIDVTVLASSKFDFAWPPKRGITAAKACEALAKHLGVRFRVTPSTGCDIVVEPVAKVGKRK